MPPRGGHQRVERLLQVDRHPEGWLPCAAEAVRAGDGYRTVRPKLVPFTIRRTVLDRVAFRR
jgi:hypothetical protein